MLLALIISLNYEYYASGQNEYGQLGLNITSSNIKEFTTSEFMFDSKIRYLAAGQKHVFAITDQGTVYGWGNNVYYQLATKDVSQSNYPLQIRMPGNPKMVQIDGGSSHSIALDADGNVYTWGSNAKQQLARQTKGRIDADPGIVSQSLYNDEKAVQVLAQNDASYILTSNGNLYAFGDCSNGMCGGLDKNNRLNVTFKVNRVFVGSRTFFVEDVSGTLYASGMNANSELCIEKSANQGLYVTRLTQIRWLPNVSHISTGQSHTLFQVDDMILGCGQNANKQMGHQETDVLTSPGLILSDKNLRGFAACQEGSIFLFADHILSIGTSLNGELGTASSINQQFTRVNISVDDARMVLCRGDFSIIYDSYEPGTTLTPGQVIWISLGVLLGVLVIVGSALTWAYCATKNRKYRMAVQEGLSDAIGERADYDGW